ncbi:hypothetical protein V2G26_018038 [Clonostachys chloroleuca]
MKSNPEFDVSPSDEGSASSYIRRQLFYTPSIVAGVKLDGKTAIVTGSSSGIGLETSRQLLDLGLTKLILAVRNEQKANAVVSELSRGRSLPENAIEVWLLDYSSYDSIIAFTERTRSLERIDIVILNAAMMPVKQTLNPETGHDESVQVNYLGTALLTILMTGVIKDKPESQPARITVTGSDVAAWTKFAEQDNDPLLPALDKPDGWNFTDRHFVTKLLYQLFLRKLEPIVPASVAVINVATPGMVHDSELDRHAAVGVLGKTVAMFQRRIGYTSSVGARHITDAAVRHGSESHGQYLSQQRVKPMAPLVYTSSGEKVAERLWKETMEEFKFANVQDILAGLKK